MKKFTSRKFLANLLTTAVGIGTVFTNSNEEGLIIAGIIIIALSNIVYMIIEGNIDSKSIINIVSDSATKVVDTIENNDSNRNDSKISTKTELKE